ncbi:protein TIC 62, chloroplastic isoform X2 [Punica granatum]|uniref:Protein TIC 62, chloroplastic isoform X2 n=1 Tax=Punica granatum TaxID=22663 RepID=A0A6P8CQS9_PUNGR|nr:protein TIC 62, chloroplastic isoform X2 [Punica granatum]
MAAVPWSVPELPLFLEPSFRTPHRSPLLTYRPLQKFHKPFTSFQTSRSSSKRRAVVPAVTSTVVNDEVTESPSLDAGTAVPASSKVVLVLGGSGGVGQLVVASLLKRDIKTRLILRNPEKAVSLFGEQDEEKLKVWKGDTRNAQDLHPSMFEGVTHVICCTGTTAFPSKRWEGDNSPERVDWEGVRNVISALPKSLKRVVLVSSVGVTKCNELPWSIMNLFGVLKYKKMGEDFLRESGLPFTILRPGRLTDGPYTSYDLNTLLKATAGERRAVVIGQGDKLVGEASRLVVAEACIQLLDIEFAEGEAYEINSVVCGRNYHLSKEKVWKELLTR